MSLLKSVEIGSRFLALGATMVLSLALVAAPSPAQSQSENSSVADAARRARERKKNAQKPVRTLTNDDLPQARGENLQPATPPSGDESNSAGKVAERSSGEKTDSLKTSPEKDDIQKKAAMEAEWKRAKAELAQAQSELDLLQRKAALDKDSFYSQTNFSSDTAGQTRLEAEARQVMDKKSQVEELKAKIASLQAELGKPLEPSPQ
jgi:hypothetical protein